MDLRTTFMDALKEALASLVAGFEGTNWYVFGAQAVRLWGTPRQTIDIDVTVALPPSDVDALVTRLAAHRLRSRAPDPRRFAERYWVVPLLHDNGTPVDVVLAGTPFEHAALGRKRQMSLHGVDVPVVAPEDLVVYKLLSDRPKDDDDARSVIRRQADALDAGAIRKQLRAAELAHDRSDLVQTFDAELAAALRYARR
jgi:hypothetical protein